MRIFISYSRQDEGVAETLATRLATEDHDVFWDRNSLPPGESFDDQLHAGIENSELFICLVSAGSLKEGKYARTELKFAQQKWPNPSGRVLPIMLDDKAVEQLPSYLRSVTVPEIEGNMPAEVAALVREIAAKPARRLKILARVISGLMVAALAGWFVYDTLTARPIELSAVTAGDNYKATVTGNNALLQANTDYIRLLDRGLQGLEHVDGSILENLISHDEGAVSSLPLIKYLISNRTDESIVIDRLRVSVLQSHIDGRPLWWTSSVYRHSNCVINAALIMGNEGWGNTSNIEYNFDLVPKSGLNSGKSICPIDKAGERCFSKAIPDVASAGTVSVEFWNEFSAYAPASVAFLKANQQPGTTAGEFSENLAVLAAATGAQVPGEALFALGEIHYDNSDGKRESFSFRQELQIVQQGACVAPVMQAMATYDVELRPEGVDYSVESPIAHSIEAGASEEIDLRVWVEKSSKHDFRASIRVGDKWIDAPDNLRLEYYLPVHAEIYAMSSDKIENE